MVWRQALILIGLGIQIASTACFAESNSGIKKVEQQYMGHEDKKLVDDCVAEVTGMHQFFEGWFKGSIERTPENYARSTSAIMDEFSQITPDGNYWERQELFPKLEESYGMYSKSDPSFRLWIENARAVQLGGTEFCLTVYIV